MLKRQKPNKVAHGLNGLDTDKLFFYLARHCL